MNQVTEKRTMSLNDRDSKLIWHPFVVGKIPEPVIGLTKASGSYVFDENGKPYLDLVSSWWVNVVGHCNEEISEAVSKQSRQLDHVIFGGFTHEPAIELCERLHKLLPSPLERFLFADNGSTAIETAIKMTYHYWLNKGYTTKTSFITFEKGYHGSTFGAMSLGVASGLCTTFEKLLFPVITIPYPETWFDEEEAEISKKEKHSLDLVEYQLREHNDEVAALFVEPLIQGVGGMRVCRPQFIEQLTTLTRRYQVPIVFDEVFCGFGRTGTMFAFEQTNSVPDILCLSKGLTGGMLPLSLVVTSEQMYQTFLDDDYKKALPHGHSYTAHPLGCAAAIATLKILTRPATKRTIQEIAEAQKRGLLYLRQNSKLVEKLRVIGTIAAFSLTSSSFLKDFRLKCLEEGLIIRPVQGNTISLVPPYCITTEEIEKTYKTIARILSSYENK